MTKKTKLETNIQMQRVAVLVDRTDMATMRTRMMTTGVPISFQIRQAIKFHLTTKVHRESR